MVKKNLIKKTDLLAIIFILIYALIVLFPTFQCHGYLLNTDLFGHFFASNSLIDGLRQKVLFGNYDLHGGMDTLTNYSPLFYYAFALFYLIFSFLLSLHVLWIIYLFLIVLVIAVGVYFLLSRLGFTKPEAFFAAIFAITFRYGLLSDFSPSAMYEIGIAPFVFSFVFVPFCLLYLFKLFEDKSLKSVFLAALFLALVLLSHLYSLIVLVIFIFFYAIYKIITDKQKRILIIRKLLLFSALFLLLTSFCWFVQIKYASFYISSPTQELDFSYSVKYLKDFFTNQFGDKLDFRFPILLIFGFAGIVSTFLSRRLQKEKVFLLIFLVSSLLVAGAVTNFLPLAIRIKFPLAYEYAYNYGRTMAFIKYVWIFFGVIGIYETILLFARLINHILSKCRIVITVKKMKFLISLAAIIIFSTIAVSQYKFSTSQIKDYTAFKCFKSQNDELVMNRDLTSVAQMIGQNSLRGRIMADFSFYPSEKYILPILVKDHGFIANFPMDRNQVKAKGNIDRLYQANEAVSPDLIGLVDELGVDYIVVNFDNPDGVNAYPYYLENNFEEIYHNQLGLLRRKGVTKIVEPNNEQNPIDIKLELPNKIIIKNPQAGQTYAIKENYYPKWHAYQNGKELNIYPSDSLANINIISEENSPIELKYQDDKTQLLFFFASIGIFIYLYFRYAKK